MTAGLAARSRVEKGQTRKEEAYRLILEMVLRGEVNECEYLAEQRLAEAFGMSRAPVREALHALCTERIMESVPRMGYRVAPISLREILDCIDVRLLLETESVRRACLNRAPESLELLDSLIVRYSNACNTDQNLRLWIRNADSIHLFLAEMSNNVILARSIAPIIDLIRRASIQLINEGRLKPEEEHLHLSILESVRRGEADIAQSLMREDILVLKNILLSR